MKNTFVLDGRLIDLQFVQAQILLAAVGASPLHWHPICPCARSGPRCGESSLLVVVPSHDLHEGGVQQGASLGVK